VIKYLGSKRTLLTTIVDAVRAVAPAHAAPTVLDLFSGTSRVGHALKGAGFRVLANDHNAYAHTLAHCYVQADRESVLADAERLIAELQSLPGRSGYFTETFCVRSRFIHPDNGRRIDAMREHIDTLSLKPDLRAVLLVSLMEAADRVDSTTGVQMAYLKQWAPRALQPIRLRMPDVLPSTGARCEAHMLDAFDAGAALRADVAYLDPPYNQHSYLGNYHVWESLIRWDKPDVYGVACKRLDCRERRSLFNSRPAFEDAMRRLLGAIRAPALVVSFSDEGYLPRERMEALLAERVGAAPTGGGLVRTLERDYPRYVGARIGIYNPRGEKVGRISHLRNREYVYVAVEESLREQLLQMSHTDAPALAASA
jgi:adenine-specific DNA-methyltransferase